MEWIGVRSVRGRSRAGNAGTLWISWTLNHKGSSSNSFHLQFSPPLDMKTQRPSAMYPKKGGHILRVFNLFYMFYLFYLFFFLIYLETFCINLNGFKFSQALLPTTVKCQWSAAGEQERWGQIIERDNETFNYSNNKIINIYVVNSQGCAPFRISYFMINTKFLRRKVI